MSNIERIPLQDNYEVELAQGITDTALTFSVDIAPSYTPTTRKTWAVLNPGKANMELVKVDGYDAGTKEITIPTGGRAQPLYEGHTATAYAHGSGSVVMISDNFAFWDSIYDAVNSKLDSNGGNTGSTFDLDLTGSSWRLRNDAGLMKFTDDQQAEVSLKTLADAAGVNDKAKVSVADTTTGYLNTKVTVGTGLTKTITSPAGDERLEIGLATQYIPVSDHVIYTPAYMTGGNGAESTFSDWLAVLAGSFRLTLDGTAYNVDGINFTGVTDMDDVAGIIQTALRTASSTLVTVTWVTDHFLFTSANTTSASEVSVLETSTGTVGTDISGAGASAWIDAETGRGVATAAVLNRVADAGKGVILDASGNIDSDLLEANLREADTFFGITTMTGAQANTLVAGVTSVANALHTHTTAELVSAETVQSDQSPSGASKTGSITIATGGVRAKLIKFTVTVYVIMQTGTSATAYITSDVILDLINQRLVRIIVNSVTTAEVVTPIVQTAGTWAPFTSSQAMSSSVFTVSKSGATSRIDTITSDSTQITFAYTLNTGTPSTDPGGIAISAVVVLA